MRSRTSPTMFMSATSFGRGRRLSMMAREASRCLAKARARLDPAGVRRDHADIAVVQTLAHVREHDGVAPGYPPDVEKTWI